MWSPKRWTLVGLAVLGTVFLTVIDIVDNFHSHEREDHLIVDCLSTFKDDSSSDVPSLFALMILTKICLALTQLGLAIDCFVAANMRLKGSTAAIEPVCVCVCLGLYLLISLVETILVTATLGSTDCVSCCFAHQRVRVYLAWSVPSLLLVALIAVAILLALLFVIYLILESFRKLLWQSFTYDALPTVVSKDVEVV